MANQVVHTSMEIATYNSTFQSCGDVKIDVTSEFETKIQFPSRDLLIDWARNIGKSCSFAVTVKASDKLEGGRARPRVILGCDRGGFYRDTQCKKGWTKQNLRKSTSKRCGCPFSLIGRKNAFSDEWTLEVKCGIHNHEMVQLEAHATVGRLDSLEKKIVHDMYASNVKPRSILSTLKKRNAGNHTVMRTIYNERHRLQKEELNGATPIQYLYKCLTDNGYLSFNRVVEGSKNLISLFFAHPVAIKLSRIFSTVYLMDCTYKTNRYRLPLLSIVGVTSTQLTFFSAFAFISDESESSYTWALEHFRSKWMTILDLGLVIATCYNVGVAHLSRKQSLTFLPLDSPLPLVPKVIFIGFINDNHFVRLTMKEGSPLPPLYSPWRRYHTQLAISWGGILNLKEGNVVV